MLSICVTVRVVAVLGERADDEILEIKAAALVASPFPSAVSAIVPSSIAGVLSFRLP